MNLSNSTIDKIGEIIRQGKNVNEYDASVAILNEWRESHGEILDEFYDKCVVLAEKIDKSNIIVAQRLKRLPTIIGKLNRFKNMRLSSMQDVAGVRVVVDDMDQFRKVERQIRRWENLVKISDYIDEPKSSGYRGKHYIFKKNGMFVEIQLRTNLQHLWATSVETTDLFRGSSLKEKDDGTYWHDFFCQVSSIFALSENAKPVFDYKGLGLGELCDLLGDNMRRNHIDSQITSFALTEPIIADQRAKNAYYMVISLDFGKKEATITRYKESEYHKAFEKYRQLEQANAANKQTVMIAVNQIKKIRDAYPNYFMNLSVFLIIINFILANNNKKR